MSLFLQFYNFRKFVCKSPAKRNAYFYRSSLNLQEKFRKLTMYRKWKAGRADSGRTVIWTRSALLVKQKMVRINYHLRFLKLGFIAGFQFVPFRNKLLSLVYFSNGAAAYYLSTELHELFMFLFFNFRKKLRKLRLKNTFLMLFQIKKLSFVSCIELLPGRGAQYVRSSGTRARIIKFDRSTHSALMQLPSDTRKIFSYYSFVLLGRISLAMNKYFANGRAGYWRTFGVKPTVRGVAMNPVDHPHGGRTKAIRYPRTPWGKTTKFK